MTRLSCFIYLFFDLFASLSIVNYWKWGLQRERRDEPVARISIIHDASSLVIHLFIYLFICTYAFCICLFCFIVYYSSVSVCRQFRHRGNRNAIPFRSLSSFYSENIIFFRQYSYGEVSHFDAKKVLIVRWNVKQNKNLWNDNVLN